MNDMLDHLQPADLRGILKYVPLWQDHIFIISIDASILQHENLPNILIDIAVLHNLNIKVVLTFGIGLTLENIALEKDIHLSDIHGTQPIDSLTLREAIKATGLIQNIILEGLSRNHLNCAIINAVRATEKGIIKGIDQKFLGKVDKVNTKLLMSLIQSKTIPVISPIGFTRNGQALRLNSDSLAASLASALNASKIIYLTQHQGLYLKNKPLINLTIEEAEKVLNKEPENMDENIRSKLTHAIKAVDQGTPRVHMIDGRINDALLTEIFSTVGIGTMIYANEYSSIRKATLDDVQVLLNMTQTGVKDESLKSRTRDDIERQINAFYVYEIDKTIVACISLKPYHESNVAEIEAVYVIPFYQGHGLGKKLIEYVEQEAQKQGIHTVFALSTQSYSFFLRICGFTEASIEELPPSRQKELEQSGRNSRIAIKYLS